MFLPYSATIIYSFYFPVQVQKVSDTLTIEPKTWRSIFKDYAALAKVRLSLLVVYSAVIGFLLASGADFSPLDLFLLFSSGFLVTAASNTLNQVAEKNFDGLMKRTAERPLVRGSLSVNDAVVFAAVVAVVGIMIQVIFIGPLAALLSMISLVIYAFVYTPMKRLSPFAVWVGAIPGALPVLIGWAAVTNSLPLEAWLLFAIQFIWQFPHFWAIAWVNHDDYTKAGFFLLPARQSTDGRTQLTGLLCLLHTLLLVGIGLYYGWMELAPIPVVLTMIAAGLVFSYYAFRLTFAPQRRFALAVMLASFLYLPVVLTSLYIGKIL